MLLIDAGFLTTKITLVSTIPPNKLYSVISIETKAGFVAVVSPIAFTEEIKKAS